MNSSTQKSFFDRLAGAAVRASGSSAGFSVAVIALLVWAATGPLADFSENWQLVVNTGTTIITFLMVFLIQHAQNKDSTAIHLKLNELIASHSKASNRLVSIEDLDEKALDQLHAFYRHLADLSGKSNDIHESHSYDEATALHTEKQKLRSHHHSRSETD